MSDQQLQIQQRPARSETGSYKQPPELYAFLRGYKPGDKIPDILFIKGRAIDLTGLTQEQRGLWLKALGETTQHRAYDYYGRQTPYFSLRPTDENHGQKRTSIVTAEKYINSQLWKTFKPQYDLPSEIQGSPSTQFPKIIEGLQLGVLNPVQFSPSGVIPLSPEDIFFYSRNSSTGSGVFIETKSSEEQYLQIYANLIFAFLRREVQGAKSPIVILEPETIASRKNILYRHRVGSAADIFLVDGVFILSRGYLDTLVNDGDIDVSTQQNLDFKKLVRLLQQKSAIYAVSEQMQSMEDTKRFEMYATQRGANPLLVALVDRVSGKPFNLNKTNTLLGLEYLQDARLHNDIKMRDLVNSIHMYLFALEKYLLENPDLLKILSNKLIRKSSSPYPDDDGPQEGPEKRLSVEQEVGYVVNNLVLRFMYRLNESFEIDNLGMDFVTLLENFGVNLQILVKTAIETFKIKHFIKPTETATEDIGEANLAETQFMEELEKHTKVLTIAEFEKMMNSFWLLKGPVYKPLESFEGESAGEADPFDGIVVSEFIHYGVTRENVSASDVVDGESVFYLTDNSLIRTIDFYKCKLIIDNLVGAVNGKRIIILSDNNIQKFLRYKLNPNSPDDFFQTNFGITLISASKINSLNVFEGDHFYPDRDSELATMKRINRQVIPYRALSNAYLKGKSISERINIHEFLRQTGINIWLDSYSFVASGEKLKQGVTSILGPPFMVDYELQKTVDRSYLLNSSIIYIQALVKFLDSNSTIREKIYDALSIGSKIQAKTFPIPDYFELFERSTNRYIGNSKSALNIVAGLLARYMEDFYTGKTRDDFFKWLEEEYGVPLEIIFQHMPEGIDAVVMPEEVYIASIEYKEQHAAQLEEFLKNHEKEKLEMIDYLTGQVDKLKDENGSIDLINTLIRHGNTNIHFQRCREIIKDTGYDLRFIDYTGLLLTAVSLALVQESGSYSEMLTANIMTLYQLISEHKPFSFSARKPPIPKSEVLQFYDSIDVSYNLKEYASKAFKSKNAHEISKASIALAMQEGEVNFNDLEDSEWKLLLARLNSHTLLLLSGEESSIAVPTQSIIPAFFTIFLGEGEVSKALRTAYFTQTIAQIKKLGAGAGTAYLVDALLNQLHSQELLTPELYSNGSIENYIEVLTKSIEKSIEKGVLALPEHRERWGAMRTIIGRYSKLVARIMGLTMLGLGGNTVTYTGVGDGSAAARTNTVLHEFFNDIDAVGLDISKERQGILNAIMRLFERAGEEDTIVSGQRTTPDLGTPDFNGIRTYLALNGIPASRLMTDTEIQELIDAYNEIKFIEANILDATTLKNVRKAVALVIRGLLPIFDDKQNPENPLMIDNIRLAVLNALQNLVEDNFVLMTDGKSSWRMQRVPIVIFVKTEEYTGPIHIDPRDQIFAPSQAFLNRQGFNIPKDPIQARGYLRSPEFVDAILRQGARIK